MSKAVTTLTVPAAIVPSDFNISKLGNQQVATNNSNNKIESTNSTDNTIFVSSSSNLTNTPPNSVSSSSSSETSSLTGDMNSNINTNSNNTTAVNTNANLNGATNLNINSYYHPNQHHQYHNPHLNFNHMHHQPHIQYIQFSNASSPNQATTPSMNGSPLASLTSSPTTTNGSFSYHNSQHHPHLINHHHSMQNNLIHYQHPQQQQQFQQLQQFHSFHSNYKDTRWLTLEVCREFQRNKCNRNETECKFAHPPAHVEIINGKVIACYDSLKGKCTRKEPPCKYLHPPQHLKDQLLQNGKNNLVLRQVALAMMHQQQQTNPQAPQAATAALLAAAAAASGSNTTPTSNSVGQFTQFTTSPNGGANSTQANTNSMNVTTNATQFIPTALTNGGLTTYSQVQLATNGSGAQPTLLPMLANGFHHQSHHPHQLQHMQQAIYATTSDPTTLLQVSAVSPGAAAASANGLLPPQQRTDRLQQGDLNLNDVANGGTTFTLENGQTFQIPQYQIYTPIYQRAPNALSQANSTNEELNQQQADLNKATNASATATATVANMVDVVPSKKRQHDAIDQDFIPMSAANLYQTTTIPVKRTALTDSKTGMPMFQPFTQNHSNQAAAIHHLQHHAQGQPITITQHPAGAQAVAALNYPINFATMQYAPYPQTFSLPYNGHPAGLPRL